VAELQDSSKLLSCILVTKKDDPAILKLSALRKTRNRDRSAALAKAERDHVSGLALSTSSSSLSEISLAALSVNPFQLTR
jgi:hypothetical protein